MIILIKPIRTEIAKNSNMDIEQLISDIKVDTCYNGILKMCEWKDQFTNEYFHIRSQRDNNEIITAIDNLFSDGKITKEEIN